MGLLVDAPVQCGFLVVIGQLLITVSVLCIVCTQFVPPNMLSVDCGINSRFLSIYHALISPV